jgi:hypothetical protein
MMPDRIDPGATAKQLANDSFMHEPKSTLGAYVSACCCHAACAPVATPAQKCRSRTSVLEPLRSEMFERALPDV